MPLARKVSPFRIGLFIIVCGVIGIAAVVWLGASHYFRERRTFVSYFRESVQGLQADAVINYRGVGIGRVSRIDLGPDGRLIEVVMDLNPDFMVDHSLAIQLKDRGLTGLRYLEIDTAPANLAELTPELTFHPPYPLIPSYPSEIQQLKSALETIYMQISDLDLKGLTDNWAHTAELINQMLSDFRGVMEPRDWQETMAAVKRTAEATATLTERFAGATTDEGVQKSAQDLAATIAASRQASEALAKQLKGLPPNSFAKMARGWDETLTTGGTFMTNLDRQFGESNILLQQSLQQLRLLLTQLNSLAQSLKEQPNRVIIPSKEPDPFTRKK
jgi:ABC-type transporter Mla subunit MlaD